MDYNIAVIDDSSVMLNMIVQYLQMAGFSEILKYTDPRKAFADLSKKTSEMVIITDYKMPHLNGVELLDSLSQGGRIIHGMIITGDRSEVSGSGGKYPVVLKGTLDFLKQISSYIRIFLRMDVEPDSQPS